MSTEHLKEKFGKVGEKGGNGEDWLYNKLKSAYPEVNDYRDDMEKQRSGIDFSIKKPSWYRSYSLDCKTNLIIDNDKLLVSLEYIKNGKPGWFLNSKADRIFHVNTFHGKCLYYDLNDMRMLISKRLLVNDMFGMDPFQHNNDLLLKIDQNQSEVKKLWKMMY